MLVANFLTALIYLAFTSIMGESYPGIASWVWHLYGILSLANLVFVFYLFNWKRWPFYAFVGIAGVVFIINLVIGFGILDSILGLLGPVRLYFSMKSRWNLFE